jgi:hypothetical protein
MSTFPLSAFRTWSDDGNPFAANNTEVRNPCCQLVFLFYVAASTLNQNGHFFWGT